MRWHNVSKGHNSCSGYYSGFTTASLPVAHLLEKTVNIGPYPAPHACGFYDRVYVHVINTLRPRQISLLRGRADFGEIHLSKQEKARFRPHKPNNILALSGAVNNCIHANNTPFGLSLRGGGGRCWGLNCYVKARQIGLSRHA